MCATAVVEMRAEAEFLFDGGFQQVAHFGELREDERFFALLLNGCEEVQEHLHLAGFEFAGLLKGGAFLGVRGVLCRGCGAFCVCEALQECGGVVADLLERENHLQDDAFAFE